MITQTPTHTNRDTRTHTHTDTIAAGDWQGAEAVELKDTRGTDTRVGPSLICKAKKRHRAKGPPRGARLWPGSRFGI